MKQIFLIGVSLFFICSSVHSAVAQETYGTFNNWHGLEIDVSTSEDVIEKFGQPKKDKSNRKIDVYQIMNWLSEKQDEKIFRYFLYDKLLGNDEVEFYFLNNRLVVIDIIPPNALRREPNWIDPDELSQKFGLTFKPYSWKYKLKVTPDQFNRESPMELKKNLYGYWYDMMAVGKNVFIVTGIDNSRGGINRPFFIRDPLANKKKEQRKIINSEGIYPGFVDRIQIISRKLEN